jgi:pimeloyl-ACP methyl ester carboxylesterase
MGEIAKVNNIDIWWEEYGEKSNPTVLLIMGANANSMQWDWISLRILPTKYRYCLLLQFLP